MGRPANFINFMEKAIQNNSGDDDMDVLMVYITMCLYWADKVDQFDRKHNPEFATIKNQLKKWVNDYYYPLSKEQKK